MRRTYSAERYLDRVALIREHVPDCALTTDVIVGFRNAYDNAQDVQPLDVKIGALRKYADKIISKL